MKKSLCVLLSLLLLLGAAPLAAGEEERIISIDSRLGLEHLQEDPYGRYVLTADIDLAGEPWTPIPFYGQLDGNGHTIANLTVTTLGADTALTYDGNDKQYTTRFGGLFSLTVGAYIHDVTLLGPFVSVEAGEDCFLGALTGYTEDSRLENITVTSSRVLLRHTGINTGVGTLSGFSRGSQFVGCVAQGELVYDALDEDSRCEEYLGGVYAAGFGQVENCALVTRGYAQVYGYAHSGGLIGMHKLPKGENPDSHVYDTTADTEIVFFEKTESRRAYCSPTIGEDVGKTCLRREMVALHNEKKEYKRPTLLLPEKCEEPHYAEAVTAGDCHSWGYTDYTCETCGYSFRGAYTPPVHEFTEERVEPTCTKSGMVRRTCQICGLVSQETLPPKGHVPGDFVTIWEPEVGFDGLQEQRCTVCGEVYLTRSIPALREVPVESIAVVPSAAELFVGDTLPLTFTFAPAEATNPTVTFISTDRLVATVDEEGVVRALTPGRAVIRCADGQGNAAGSCVVTVRFTRRQWIRYYLLFGWFTNRRIPDDKNWEG